MIYLSEKELVAVNKKVLTGTGQQFSGVQYPQELNLVAEQPQMVIFGHELYPTIWLKAAYIMQKITKKHIFVDGNKRSAYLATMLFLLKNGYELHLTVDEGEALIMQVTLADDSEAEMQKIAELLKRKARKSKC